MIGELRRGEAFDEIWIDSPPIEFDNESDWIKALAPIGEGEIRGSMSLEAESDAPASVTEERSFTRWALILSVGEIGERYVGIVTDGEVGGSL